MNFHDNRMLAVMAVGLASLFCIGCAKLLVKQELARADEGLKKSFVTFGQMYTIPEKRYISKIVITGQGTVRNLEIEARIEEKNWKSIKKIKAQVSLPIEISTSVRTDAIRIFQRTVTGRGSIDTIELYTTRDVIRGAEKDVIESAKVARKKSISINPNLAQMHYNRGVTYDTKGMRDEAIAEYKKAISINPNLAEAHYNLGIIYDAQGKLDDAILEFQKTIDIQPNLTKAHYILGVAYRDKSKLDDAILEFQKAIDIQPDLAKAHYALGVAYRDKSKLDDAILEFQRVIMINPDFAEAYVNLGNAYAFKGDRENAMLNFQKFMVLAEANTKLQRLIPQVKKLIRQLQRK